MKIQGIKCSDIKEVSLLVTDRVIRARLTTDQGLVWLKDKSGFIASYSSLDEVEKLINAIGDFEQQPLAQSSSDRWQTVKYKRA